MSIARECRMNSLEQKLEELVDRSLKNDHKDNFDFRRFGAQKPKHSVWPPRVKSLWRLIQLILGRAKSEKARVRALFSQNISKLQWLYELLRDAESKDILVQLLAFRALGARRVKLPLNSPEYWRQLAALDTMSVGTDSIDAGVRDWRLHKMNLEKIGYPMELYLRPSGAMAQMVLQQYRCSTERDVIEVQPGDVVIDGGGCWGDTALYFAHKTGGEGKVYSFEFLRDSLDVFRRNLSANPRLASSIEIVESPLWSVSGTTLMIEGKGPATRVCISSNDPTAVQVKTLCIDDLVEQENLQRLDFIKMDIEGAEMEALIGAQKSIRRFRPKLAISVYHKFEDLWEIPQWLQQLDLGYEFSLRHFTIHLEETILFAKVRETSTSEVR